MSRANDITLIIILLQASIGFVTATGLFTENYLTVPSNGADYTISDLNSFVAPEDPGIIDEVMLFAHWAFEAFFIGIKVVFAVIFVFPTLVTVFHIPIILSLFMQAGVYYVYSTWYAQFKSGKGWKMYE